MVIQYKNHKSANSPCVSKWHQEWWDSQEVAPVIESHATGMERDHSWIASAPKARNTQFLPSSLIVINNPDIYSK